MSKLDELAKLGQSVWLDTISRSLIDSGKLKELVDRGLRGMTSNPAIFEKAIDESSDYDDALTELANADKSTAEIYETLTIKDVGDAADLMRKVYDSTDGLDGYVSLEVNPELANDTEGTIKEARHLFHKLNRPNVFIKVPATPAGIPAITTLIGEGININVTLIFSIKQYEDAANAYIAGLEKLAKSGGNIGRVSSVASFFLSRIDSAVDKELDKIGNAELQGKIAIASAKTAYASFLKIFGGARWESLKSDGARVQRPLWASTSTKNPDYPDTLYVDNLIGLHTVNTLPMSTLEAFLDHGVAKPTLEDGMSDAKKQIDKLSTLGVDLDAITQKLLDDGVEAFVKPFEKLLGCIDKKSKGLICDR